MKGQYFYKIIIKYGKLVEILEEEVGVTGRNLILPT